MFVRPPITPAQDFRQRRAEEKTIYFVLPGPFEKGGAANDRGDPFFSSIDAATGRALLIAFNTAATAFDGQVEIDPARKRLTSLHGRCPATPAAPGSATFRIPAFGTVVCEVRK